MLNILQAIAAHVLIILGLLQVIIMGNPFESTEKAQRRRLLPPELQKLYFENRQLNTIVGIIMLIAGFYIANW